MIVHQLSSNDKIILLWTSIARFIWRMGYAEFRIPYALHFHCDANYYVIEDIFDWFFYDLNDDNNSISMYIFKHLFVVMIIIFVEAHLWYISMKKNPLSIVRFKFYDIHIIIGAHTHTIEKVNSAFLFMLVYYYDVIIIIVVWFHVNCFTYTCHALQ